MASVQVDGVPEETVEALKSQAADRGLTLTAYLRAELERLAGAAQASDATEPRRPTNAEVVQRILSRDRRGGPTRDEIVEQIRRVRDAS
ncbi:hypothetical protein ACFFWE_22000 [Sphaerisporangium melleum]|nr:antitoxin [Sphaerisporangium melleum]